MRARTWWSVWILCTVLLVVGSCGPVAGVAAWIEKNNDGSRSFVTPLSLTAALVANPTGRSACATLRDFTYRVNLGGAVVKLFVDNDAGQVLPSDPDVDHRVSVLLQAGKTSIVRIEAKYGFQDTRVFSETIDLTDHDPVGLALQVSAENGGVKLRWENSSPEVKSFAIFWEEYDRDNSTLSDLGEAKSTHPAGVGVNEFLIPRLPNPDRLVKWFTFGIRGDDGCESPLVTQHAQPRDFEHSGSKRQSEGLRTTAPRLPPIVADRAGKEGADGLADILVIQEDGEVRTLINQGDQNGRLLLSEDLQSRTPTVKDPIRAFAVKLDSDRRIDLVVASARSIITLFGDKTSKAGFKQFGEGIRLDEVSECEFADVAIGDFNGDRLVDVAAAVIESDTGDLQSYRVWLAEMTKSKGQTLPVKFREHVVKAFTSVPGTNAPFLVGDFDGDGFSDILHKQTDGQRKQSRFVTYLIRPTGAVKVEVRTVPSNAFPDDPEAGFRTIGPGYAFVADIDLDGCDDLITTGEEITDGAKRIVLAGFRSDGRGKILDVEEDFFDLEIGSAQHDRVRFEVVDVDGDGLQDIAMRSTWNGSRSVDVVRVWRGKRDLASGLQAWGEFEPEFELSFGDDAEGRTPLFAGGDLDGDGVVDFCSFAEGAGDTSSVIITRTVPTWQWSRTIRAVANGGTSAALLPPTPQRGRLLPGDVLVSFLPNSLTDQRIVYLPLLRDVVGQPAGGYDLLHTSKRIERMPASPVVAQVRTTGSSGLPEIAAILETGELGSVRWDANDTPFWFRSAHRIENPEDTDLFPARVNLDGYPDVIAWDREANELISFISIFDERQGGVVLQKNSVAKLPRAASYVHVMDVGIRTAEFQTTGFRDGISDIAVVLQLPENRYELQLFIAAFQQGTGKIDYVPVVDTSEPAVILEPIISLTAANHRATANVDSDEDLTIVAGTRSGSLFEFDLDASGASNARLHSRIPRAGKKSVTVEATDLNRDGVADLLVADLDQATATAYIADLKKPDPAKPWQRTGDGWLSVGSTFDISGLRRFFFVQHANNDPFPDIVFLGDDDRSATTFTTLGDQNAVK